MTKVLDVALVAVFLGTVGAHAAPSQMWQPPQQAPAVVKDLIQQWYINNDECRGGTDARQIEIACRFRDKVQEQIEAYGWCYGEYATSGADANWTVCKHRSK
jgi:hypothetical protein